MIHEQLELFEEEEEPLPTWGEILKDPESMAIVGGIVVFLLLAIFW